MELELIRLDTGSRFYKEVSEMFDSGWKHPNTKAELFSIYVIDTKDPDLELRFHGTQRACKIGSGSRKLCDKIECNVCSILKNGFSVAHSKDTCMFGPGIYSSIISSIDYGNAKEMKAAGAPGPCDSVEGLTKAKGGKLVYPETVIYDTARIKPLGLVVYTREGWVSK
ncbi:hypothetical protein N7540_004000 [Penicillium herquei]|nr:hypothetical protein N7540_004000 [Penicillium herquei]